MKRTLHALLVTCLSAGTLLIAVTPLQSATSATNVVQDKTPIPYVPTRHDTVRDLLWLADVGTNDVLYDLGSGDGRVVIAAVRDFHARAAVGIEIKPELVAESKENAAQAGVADRVRFIQGDLFTNDFSQPSVVSLYLGHGANLDLRAQLVRNLKPGARVVSHQFGMGEWTADKLLDVRTVVLGMYGEMYNEFKTNPDVPDFDSTGRGDTHDVLSEWIVPAPVSGVWRGKVRLDSGEAELQITLHQRLSGVSGSFQFLGATNFSGSVKADLWGQHLRYQCISTNRSNVMLEARFDGQADNDSLSGAVSVWQSFKDTQELQWTARRDKADFTGTWEWSGPSNSPVQFQIGRREGRLVATYMDKNRTPQAGKVNYPIPVTDLYDFGGGFYFTLLLGREGLQGGRRAGPEDGWLVGEAVAEDNSLRGTIAFYPYRPMVDKEGRILFLPPQAGEKPAPQQARREWQPKRVAP
jgi:SAM-dependent methyltransferase